MDKRHVPLAILLAAIVALSSFYLNSLIDETVALTGPDPAAAETISADKYMDHVRFLADDELGGRGNGTPGLERAAEYLATQFRIHGLRPAGEDGTYFQTLEVTTDAAIGPDNGLELGSAVLAFNEDFAPLRFSTRTDTAAVPLVFVGYGITAPEMHWDEYAGIDATDKIVVALRHEPQEDDPDSLFNGAEPTAHASFMNKAINAKQHGAAGILFITDPNNHSADEQALLSTVASSEKDNSGIAAAYVRMEPVLAYFDEAGIDLRQMQREIDTQLEPRSVELAGSAVSFSSDVVRVREPVRNVMAAIDGSDPALRGEWIIVGAHYDHLGLGGEYSMDRGAAGEIHNGADDNASGTAGILELARVISKNRSMLGRSILFMGFAGEELGLLGSNHFVNYPTIDIENAVAMLNFDMIGRLGGDRVFVGGVGTSPGFEDLLEGFNDEVGLDLDFSESGSGSSDHTSFNLKDIPVLFFFSGLHGDYHKPSDTAEKINAEGARNVLRLAYRMIGHVAGDVLRPEYTEVFQARPLSGSGGGYGPYFGSIPDFRDDLDGVMFADVTSGSPAAKAGLRPADILTRFGEYVVGNLYDFTFALRAHQPGDVVTVAFRRDGEQMTREVTLEARQ